MSENAYAANLYAYATVGRRMVAAVIDMAALAAIAAVSYLFAGHDFRFAATCAVTFALMQWGWEGTRGRTVGKAMTGLRAVRDIPAATQADAGLLPPGLARAAVRGLVEVLASCVALVGTIALEATALTDGPRRRAWQDRIAGTAIVDASETYIGLDDGAIARGVMEGGADGIDGSKAGATATGDRRADAVGTGHAGSADAVGRAGATDERHMGRGVSAATPAASAAPLVSTAPAPAAATSAPAPPGAGPHATLYFENGTARSLPIPARVLLGRHPSGAEPGTRTIDVPDTTGTMSRTHALLEIGAESMWVTDLDSTNGTEVIGEDGPERLEAGRRREVAFGTRIMLGDTALSVTLMRARRGTPAINTNGRKQRP